jgi:hypothetical protein
MPHAHVTVGASMQPLKRHMLRPHAPANQGNLLRQRLLMRCCPGRRSEGASRDVQEELAGGLAAVMPAVNPVFFGIVGASVRVVSLLRSVPFSLQSVYPTWQRHEPQDVLGVQAADQSAESSMQRDSWQAPAQLSSGAPATPLVTPVAAALPAGGAVGGGAAGRGAGRRGVGGVCPGRPAGPRGAGRRAPPVAGHDHAGAYVRYCEYRPGVRSSIVELLDTRWLQCCDVS